MRRGEAATDGEKGREGSNSWDETTTDYLPVGDVLEFEAKRGLGITRTRDGHAEAEHEAPVTSRKPRVAAAKGKRVSEAFVASESSEGDVRSEEGGDSESGDEGKKAATNGGKQPKRKAVSV